MLRATFMLGIAALCAAILTLPAAATSSPQLIDQRGHRFTFDDLRGRPLIVTFVAATCTEACPLLNAQFAQLQQRLDDAHAAARLLTITLDPDVDTPARMRALAQRFGAHSDRWIVASGSPSEVRRVLSVFGVRVGDDHSTIVYVFDNTGTLRERMLASSNLGDVLLARLQREHIVR